MGSLSAKQHVYTRGKVVYANLEVCIIQENVSNIKILNIAHLGLPLEKIILHKRVKLC